LVEKSKPYQKYEEGEEVFVFKNGQDFSQNSLK
jgi:hypothetical protein